eukprot:IDg16662t1
MFAAAAGACDMVYTGCGVVVRAPWRFTALSLWEHTGAIERLQRADMKRARNRAGAQSAVITEDGSRCTAHCCVEAHMRRGACSTASAVVRSPHAPNSVLYSASPTTALSTALTIR